MPAVGQVLGLIPSSPSNQARLRTRVENHSKRRRKDQKFKVSLSYMVSFRPAWWREKKKNVCGHTKYSVCKKCMQTYKILSLQCVEEPHWRSRCSPRPKLIPVLEKESSEGDTRSTSLLTVHFVYIIVMAKAPF